MYENFGKNIKKKSNKGDSTRNVHLCGSISPAD